MSNAQRVGQSGANVDCGKKFGFAVQRKKPRYNRGFVTADCRMQTAEFGSKEA